jgi:iron complex outermembrane receptor protein
MHALSPMFGAVVHLAAQHSAYANVSSAFETPTTTELGNHPDGSAGLNPDLQPQYSTTYETGLRGLLQLRMQYDVSLFDTEVRDELIPFEVPGSQGRTYYRNAGRTRRQGAELSVYTYAGPLQFAAAYTYSHFRFRHFDVNGDDYAGNAIPGIPEQQLEGSIGWHHRGMYAVAEELAKSQVYVNDENSAHAAGFSVLNLRFGGTAVLGWPWLSPVLSIENVFDRRYVGSVAINASGPTLAQTKFYEPSAGRTVLIGLTVAGGR